MEAYVSVGVGEEEYVVVFVLVVEVEMLWMDELARWKYLVRAIFAPTLMVALRASPASRAASRLDGIVPPHLYFLPALSCITHPPTEFRAIS